MSRPSLAQVGRAFATAARAWWKREATDTVRRRLLVLAILGALVLFGPVFIALPIFPDPPASIPSDERNCTYDAAPEYPPSRLAPPTPMAIAAGQPATLALHIRNSGTCAWDDRVTLRREGAVLSDEPLVITATATAGNAFFNPDFSFTAPPTHNAVYTLVYRMHAPDGRRFGAPLTLSLVSHVEGLAAAPLPPSRSLVDTVITWGLLGLPALLGLAVSVDRASRFVRDFYGLKGEAHGRTFVLSRAFGLGARESAAAKDGKIAWEAKHEVLERIGGPGKLSVHAGTAALLERGGKYSRIVGPGETILAPFERARAVIDARPLNRHRKEKAFSRDGIEIQTDTAISFRLMKRRDGEQVDRPSAQPTWWRMLLDWLGVRPKPLEPPAELPASAETIRSLVYELPAGRIWENTIETGIDEVIPDKMLDELWAPEDPEIKPRSELVQRLTADATRKLRQNGVELIDLSIGPLTVPKEVDEQRRAYWQATWSRLSTVTEAEGEAGALRAAQTARAEAQAELIQAIAQSFRMMAMSGASLPSRQVALKMLEVIARTMKAALEETEDEEPADKAVKILDRLQRIIKP